jgi:hypothetical protein
MSCLFNSLSHFLIYNSNQIRQAICDYLEANQPLIDGLSTDFILSLDDSNYIRNMRKSSEWGGAIEIQAACNLWNLRIIIHNMSSSKKTKIEFLPIRKEYVYTIELLWTGNHYEPVRINKHK